MLQKILRLYIFYLGIKNNHIIYIPSKIDVFMTFSGIWAENAIFKFARKREKTARQRVRFFRPTYFSKNGFGRAVGNPRASEGQIFSLRAQRKSESGKNTFQEQNKSARITSGWNGQLGYQKTRFLNLPANAKKRPASASVFSGRHISQKTVLNAL